MSATEDDVLHLRAAYDAIRDGDTTPLAMLMDEHIHWIGDRSLGDPPPECNGREEAWAVLRRAVGRMPSRNLESVEIRGDRILAVARWEQDEGPPDRDRIYNLLTMRSGLIVRMEDCFDGAEAETAFMAPE